MVHGDLCGPITPVTLSRSRYFLLLTNDSSCFMLLHTLRTKDQAVSAIKLFQQAAEAEMGHRLQAFRMDHGGEFTSIEFTEYCVEHGCVDS
jgi:hypothetical protein